MFRKLSALVFICVATIGAASGRVLAKGPSRDAACAGLSGAAFGVCQAAIAVDVMAPRINHVMHKHSRRSTRN